MSWESPRVKGSKESSKDSVLNTCRRNRTEGTEKLDVSERGTLLVLDGLFPELVISVITTEPNKTKKSIESVKELEEDATTMLPLMLI